MKDLKLARVTFCLRLLCLAAMIVAGCLVSMVFFSPKSVDKWGVLLITRHEQNLTKGFARLYNVFKEENPLSETGHQEILSFIAKIRKHDRFAAEKREFLEQISNHYQQKGNYQEALKWVGVWEEFDERDLFAKVRRAKIYLAMPEKADEGRALARQLFEMAPEIPVVNNLYLASQWRK